MQPLLALLVTFGLMWALLIRPQQRRMKQHQAVVSSLRAGDEIVTAGGIYGTVLSVDDDSMMVEVAPGVELRILRAAVSTRIVGDDDYTDDDEIDDDENVTDGTDGTDGTDDGTVEDIAVEDGTGEAGGHRYRGVENGNAGLSESAREKEEET